MRLLSALRPKDTLSENDVARGLRILLWEGAAAQGFFSITSGALLAAFALALGASNTQIGILAALPFITQLLQIPAIPLVNKLRQRKLITLSARVPAQLLWIVIALLPFLWRLFGPSPAVALIVLLVVRGMLAAVSNCSWNGWMRDLLPKQGLGRFFSTRLAVGAVVTAVLGLAGGLFIDLWTASVPTSQTLYGYTIIFLTATLTLALASPILVLMVPEPRMPAPEGPPASPLAAILTPFCNSNYRKLLRFQFCWGIAANLAAPFMTIYMLQRLGLPLSLVMVLGVVAQVSSLLFMRVWGRLADQYGSKAVMYASASLYLLIVSGWMLNILPYPRALVLPLLVALHVFAGISSAGMALTGNTISLKLAPQGEGTSYLAAFALASNVGTGLGPLLGGLLADYFAMQSLSLGLTWTAPEGPASLVTLALRGFDFLFLLTVITGIGALSLLRSVQEDGEVSESALLEDMLSRSGGLARAVGAVPGARYVVDVPLSVLRRVPGLSVALGVSAYQVGAVTDTAAAAWRRRSTVIGLMDDVGETLKGIVIHGNDEWPGNHPASSVPPESINAEVAGSTSVATSATKAVGGKTNADMGKS